ncbi:MAG: VOC family protein [bacterium]
MMKSSEMVVVVDSVETAIKFYTEKLGFDVVDLRAKGEIEKTLSYGRVKKGKCFISFRLPEVEELADFSFIKRCVSRSTGLYAVIKKGIEKLHEKCQKKALSPTDIVEKNWGDKVFSIKDPFGIKLTFAQPIAGFVVKKDPNFYGLILNPEDIRNKGKEKELVDKMAAHLKRFGVLRRAAKKYSKLWLKDYRS